MTPRALPAPLPPSQSRLSPFFLVFFSLGGSPPVWKRDTGFFFFSDLMGLVLESESSSSSLPVTAGGDGDTVTWHGCCWPRVPPGGSGAAHPPHQYLSSCFSSPSSPRSPGTWPSAPSWCSWRVWLCHRGHSCLLEGWTGRGTENREEGESNGDNMWGGGDGPEPPAP